MTDRLGYNERNPWITYGCEHTNDDVDEMSTPGKLGMIVIGNTFTSGAAFLYNLVALAGNFLRMSAYSLCRQWQLVDANHGFMNKNLDQLEYHLFRMIPIVGYLFSTTIDGFSRRLEPDCDGDGYYTTDYLAAHYDFSNDEISSRDWGSYLYEISIGNLVTAVIVDTHHAFAFVGNTIRALGYLLALVLFPAGCLVGYGTCLRRFSKNIGFAYNNLSSIVYHTIRAIPFVGFYATCLYDAFKECLCKPCAEQVD